MSSPSLSAAQHDGIVATISAKRCNTVRSASIAFSITVFFSMARADMPIGDETELEARWCEARAKRDERHAPGAGHGRMKSIEVSSSDKGVADRISMMDVDICHR